MRRSPPLLLIVALGLGARPARAQTDPAAAQAMFDEAKRLRDAGRLSEACPKFLASFKLDPKPGAALNLADCYERNGQLASAWARYQEASSLAQRAGQTEREQVARDRAVALEPKLSKLTVAVVAPPPGLEVRRDGVVIDLVMLGSAVPVDPGKHVVEVRAPGKKTWSTTVEVPQVGGQLRVDIPALADAAGAEPATPPVGQPPSAPEAAPVRFWGAQRVAGLAAGIAGLAGIAVGSAFGAIAASKWSDAKNNHCGGTTVCDPTGVTLAGDAKTAANVSTGAFIPGAALLVGGIIVFATAPRSAKSPPSVGFVVAPAARGGAVLTVTGEM